MSGKAEKLQWHPAFCAATELELRQDLDVLELIPEYNLSKKPLQIDLVIIKRWIGSGRYKMKLVIL